jgi:type VI secretion system protein ImpJ
MNIDQPLYWHQGLFLQPQHLQHNDRLNAHRVARLAQVSMPHAWGIVSLQIAEASLATGQMAVNQLSVCFRDGTLAEFPGNALLEPRSFVPGELANGPRTVFVGLRRVVPGQPNAGMYETLDAAARAQTRFATLAEPQSAPDYLEGKRAADVRAMHYVLRLFWEHEVPDLANYELVAMARIEQDGDVTHLSSRFVPPCANIGASPALTQILRDVRDELIGRAHQLEVYKHPADAAQGEFDPGQLRLLMALAVLNRFGPLLCHLLETPQVHPWDVYGTLRQLVGELSWFSMRCDMLGRAPDGQVLVPAYRHDELGPQLAAVASLIGQMMNEITFGPEQVVRFTETSSGWLAELPDAFLAVRNRYYLVVSGMVDAEQLGVTLPRDAKLGAPNEVDDFVTRSLPGVELLYLQVPPAGMPRRSGAVYFRIEQMSEAWVSVVRSRAAVLFFPDAPKQFVAELVAVTR